MFKISRISPIYKLTLLFILSAHSLFAQTTISGKINDETGAPLSKVSITLLGKPTGTMSSDSGTFKISVPYDKAFALVFSHLGYKKQQRNFLLNRNEQETISITMERGGATLQAVVFTDQSVRKTAGLVRMNPKNAILMPSPAGGIERMIQVLVGSNNELSSQYNVRGGNYDENLIYVNDFEVFRPYLVRSGQQEGLSFIHPELVKNVDFYNGGFQAKYGDKMSSVLDIQYKKPKNFGGSAYIGLLEQGLHFEGVSKNKKFTFLAGIRNRNNQSLLSSQETKGNYKPSSSDFQALLTYQINEKHNLELLGNISGTSFGLIPQFSQLTSSVFSPYFSANLGLDIFFEGREQDSYRTQMMGLSWNHQLRKNLKLKWMLSRFTDDEKESVDISGAYLFGDRQFDKSRPDFGMINNPLGAGQFQNFARNRLNINVWNIAHKGSINLGQHFGQWGLQGEQQLIHDKLNEWEYTDSAGYSLPYHPGTLNFSKVLKSQAHIEAQRFSGYLQDNFVFHDSSDFSIQAGVRFNYNTLNKEFLVSPRAGISYKPHQWSKDILFKAAAGLYHQPPFYRELRKYDGTLNLALRSQKSWQVSGGMDYSFKKGNRAYRVTTEAYYKHMWDVVPYDIDNVRIRYFGENRAKAYTAGIETRVYGELVKDAESWFSIGLMRSRENIQGDQYYRYKLDSLNQPIDSSLTEAGWLRRPSDRFFTLGLYLQDYLSTNKNAKVFLNLLYGSNLPYNIPGSVKYRNGLQIPPYIRIDMGFSFLLLDVEKSNRRSHDPFRNFENIWASFEVFNLIDRDNTISYLLIKDFANTIYAMPNRLTPRLLNLKLVARF